MAKANRIFKIHVAKWREHNPGKKKSHKKTMIANNFTSDAKVCAVPASVRWLFLHVLLMCGDSASEVVEMTERQVSNVLGTCEGGARALGRLQSLQLLTFEEITPLITELKNNRRITEEKQNLMVPVGSDGPPPVPAELSMQLVPAEPIKPKPNTEANRKVWEAYSKEYQNRYQVEPVRNAKVNSAISDFVKRLGEVEAVEVVRFYVWHNGSFYVKNMHSIGLALKDAEGLRTQWLKGRAITDSDVRRFEKQNESQETIEALRRGEV